jgi:hypothetical protein
MLAAALPRGARRFGRLAPLGPGDGSLRVASDGAGGLIASWDDPYSGPASVVHRPAGGTFGPVRRFGPAPVNDLRVAAAAGRAAAVWTRSTNDEEQFAGAVALATGAPAGAFGPLRTLSGRGQDPQFADVAVLRDGTPVAAWVDGRDAEIGLRAAGPDLGALQRLGTRGWGARSVAVAGLGAGGAVAWHESSSRAARLRVADLRSDGTAVRPRPLGPRGRAPITAYSRETWYGPAIATAGRRGVLAWELPATDEEFYETAGPIYVSVTR